MQKSTTVRVVGAHVIVYSRFLPAVFQFHSCFFLACVQEVLKPPCYDNQVDFFKYLEGVMTRLESSHVM